jgi:predicted flap endonuclease-1-like 5' DNA nuclease
MRLDFILYGLAIISFIVAIFLFFVVGEQDGQIIYVFFAVGLGILLIGSGYFLRPTKTTRTMVSTQEDISKETEMKPIQKATAKADVSNKQIEMENVKQSEVTQKSEITMLEEQLSEISKAAKIKPAAQNKAHQIEVQKVEKSLSSKDLSLTNIRGINAKRADQMKSNGITNIEDLAKASSSELASKLEVSERIVKMWIGTAKKIIK